MLVPRRLTHQEYQATILGPLNHVVQSMEVHGVPVSLEVLADIRGKAEKASEDYLNNLQTWGVNHGFSSLNFNSPVQLVELFEASGIPRSPYYKKGLVPEGKVSTDSAAVDWLVLHCPEHRERLKTLIEYRRAKRIVDYAVKWTGMATQREGYATLHPSFGLATDNDSRPGAVTGRFAVKNPALNQVPSSEEKDKFGIKDAFIAPPGSVVLTVDASQLEVVLIADKATRLFGTTGMADRLRNNVDFHTFTAKEIFGRLQGDQRVLDVADDQFKKVPYTKAKRETAKALRYGTHYEKSGQKFGETLFDEEGNAIGHEEGFKLLDGLYQADPELALLRDFRRWWLRKYGVTCTAFGRWRMCPGWDSEKRGLFNRACRIEANWYAQGTGQEILALALVAVSNDSALRAMGYRPTLPVHDEILGVVLEQHAEEAAFLVEKHIETAVELMAPLKAVGGWGPSWKRAKGK